MTAVFDEPITVPRPRTAARFAGCRHSVAPRHSGAALSQLVRRAYDIALIGSVLPSLTHQYALATAMKVFVSFCATIEIVVAIRPARRLTDRYGGRKILIAGTAAHPS